jgi:hypothetical protein
MKTPTHPIPERYAAMMERMRPAPGAGPIEVALWMLFAALFGLLASFAARRAREQACQQDAGAGDDAGVERGGVGVPGGFDGVAGGGGADRRGAAGGRDAGGRVVSASRSPRRPAGPRATARPRTIAAGTQAACARHADEHTWPRSRGSLLSWSVDAGFWRLDSQKWGCPGGENCADFVTISK